MPHPLLVALYRWIDAVGFDPRRLVFAPPRLVRYLADYLKFRRGLRRSGAATRIAPTAPCIHDRHDTSGSLPRHYFYQDLLVARRIHERKPGRHIDVGSRVDGFIAHVASFRPIEVVDIRPPAALVPNVTFLQADLLALPPDMTACCDSLSCLHALEHIGLGRYGDPIDPAGHLKGFDALRAMLRPGGVLYLGVPIGPERVEFNGHRVLAVKSVLGMAAEGFDLTGFSYIDDDNALHEDVPLDDELAARDCGAWYGCGIFEFRRR